MRLVCVCNQKIGRNSCLADSVKVKEGSGECVWFDGNLSGTENEFTENFADQPRNKYGRTKREAERLCLAASKIQESSDFSTQNSSESSDFSTQNSSATETEVKKKGQSVLVLRAPRFFCEDVLPSEGNQIIVVEFHAQVHSDPLFYCVK